METPKALILTIIVLNLVSRGYFLLNSHITDPSIRYRTLRYRQSVVPFIDSSGCREVYGVLKNVADLTGKHLCRNLFFHKVSGLRPEALLKIRHSDIGVTMQMALYVLLSYSTLKESYENITSIIFQSHIKWYSRLSFCYTGLCTERSTKEEHPAG